MHTQTKSPALPATEPAELRTRQVWRHSFGEMLIETRADGTVWIDGKVVLDTLPVGCVLPAKVAEHP